MNAIAKYLEAAKKAREATFESYPQAQFDLRVAASNAAKEIDELVTLCETYFSPHSDSLTGKDIKYIEDRIREIVGGGV